MRRLVRWRKDEEPQGHRRKHRDENEHYPEASEQQPPSPTPAGCFSPWAWDLYRVSGHLIRQIGGGRSRRRSHRLSNVFGVGGQNYVLTLTLKGPTVALPAEFEAITE